MKRLSYLLLALSVLAGATPALRGEENKVKQLDDIFRDWSKHGTPGAAVAVIQHGKIVFEKGYGAANLEYDDSVTPQTVFHVASVSKQFTAMAVVLLEQEGKLSLEDDVHKYLPELFEYGCKVTIRQLLQHTSGIRDQWQTLALAGWRLDDVITQEQILRLLFRQKELNFASGTKHLYSNGGYTLAAEVVARVSGQSFPVFCEERIFRPLGMNATHFHLDHRRIVPGRAYSYGTSEGGYQALPLNYANVGATSLFTTAPDLVRWLDNFRHATVGGRIGVDRMQETAVLSDGQKIDYALGLSIGQHRGLKTVSHGGGDAGYRSFVLWFPEEELGIAVVSGLASFDSSKIAHLVAEVFLGDKMSAPVAQSKPVFRQYILIEPKSLEQYVGHYRLDSGIEADVVKKEDKLYAQVPGQGSQELKPLATNRFFIESIEGEVEFTSKPSGTLALKFTQPGSSMTAERIGLTTGADFDLSSYPGVYWSDELETQYTIVLKGTKLIAVHLHHGEIELVPVGKDRFAGAEWFMPSASFFRDSSDHITGVTLGGGRVVGIRFLRK